MDMDSSNAELFSLRGIAHFGKDNREQAFSDWSQAVGLVPSRFGDPLVLLYTDLLADHPNDKEILYRRSEAYVAVSKYAEAIRDANAAIAQDGRHAGAYFVRGMAHWGLEQRAQAEQDFSRALKLDPSSSPAHYQLGLLNSQLYRESNGMNVNYLANADQHFDQAALPTGRYNYLKALLYASAGTRDQVIKAIRFCHSAIAAEPYNLEYSALMTKLQETNTQLRNNAIDAAFFTFLGFWIIGAASGGGSAISDNPPISKGGSLGSVIDKVQCIRRSPGALAARC